MVVLAAIAVGVALILQRREPGEVATTTRQTFTAPTQINRADFAQPGAPWLVALFSSKTCDSCKGSWERTEPLESDQVAVQRVDVEDHKDLHDRYNIEAVPTTVIVNNEGVVMRSFLGPASVTHLWAAVAEAREPGSVPQSCTTTHDHS